ncbi:MAG: DMT family transporter [Parvibaculaceae bacterium]
MAVIAEEAGGAGLRSGLFMSVAMASYIINDSITKWIGSGVGVGQFMFVRGIFASALLFAVLCWTGRPRDVVHLLDPRIMLRGILDFVATAFFIFALLHLPIGDLNALQQASPLAGAALAWMILGERFGWRRFVAIVLGFLGVLLIVKPGVGAFDIHVLAGLASMLCSAFRDVVTRRIATHVSSQAVALANAFVVGMGGLGIALFEGFAPMSAATVGAIGIGSMFLVIGYIFFVLAIRTGGIAGTAPFRYTVIVWALLSGYLVFGEIPDVPAMIGIALIVGAGLFTIYRAALRLPPGNSRA